MIGRSVLIVGGGIAGPALAFWLLRYGFAPTLVERAPRLRTEGYVIDFWGTGYDIVEQMGLLPQVLKAGHQVNEVRFVNRAGRRTAGLDVELFRAATEGRYMSLPRSGLSAILHGAIADRACVRWGDGPTSLVQQGDGVLVGFESGTSEHFDIVVGADGLHSVVRQQIFGKSAQFEKYLGFRVAAFESTGYPKRDETAYVNFGTPGLQVGRLSLRDDRTLFLLVSAEAEPGEGHLDLQATKAYLHARFGRMGWEVPGILAAADGCEEIYLDRVSQIRMRRWYRGYVGLLGDAAYAPSLLAGQGAALAVVGAYVLAGELARGIAPEGAFERYQDLLQPFIVEKQEAAVKLAGSFVPQTQLGLWLRNAAMQALAIPGVGRFAMRKTFNDDLRLPNYLARGA
jgi:2-polyprenyl-6-methoxyphenol hydroxylase-like FAD-dependent oxidoreductase